jgi:hypothetical protein
MRHDDFRVKGEGHHWCQEREMMWFGRRANDIISLKENDRSEIEVPSSKSINVSIKKPPQG